MTKQKIAMVTFCGARNFGSVLQSYALQEIIRANDYEPELLIQKEPAMSPIRKIQKLAEKDKWYSFHQKILRIIGNRKSASGIKKINEFKKKNINIRYFEPEEQVPQEEYEKYIAGSDQIWSVNCGKLSDFITLQFVKDVSKKFSYAVSLGSGIFQEQYKAYYQNALQSFIHLSIREPSGQKKLKEIIKREVRQDIDPVLLPEKDMWEKLASDRLKGEAYIFVYQIRPDKKLISMAKQLAQKENMKLYYIGSLALKDKKVNSIYDAGVEDFLGYIKNASYVITNSFHGTLFSIIMEKKFISCHIQDTGYRMKEFLCEIGLDEHYIEGSNGIDKIRENIDYNKVTGILNGKREESLKYLHKILHNC